MALQFDDVDAFDRYIARDVDVFDQYSLTQSCSQLEAVPDLDPGEDESQGKNSKAKCACAKAPGRANRGAARKYAQLEEEPSEGFELPLATRVPSCPSSVPPAAGL